MDRNQNENQWDDGDVFGSDADMVPAEEPVEDYEEEYEEEPVRAAGWRMLAVIFMLLGVGGLFLGLLYKVVSAFTPVAWFMALRYPDMLAGSLAGYAIGYVKFLIDGGFSQILEGGVRSIMTTVVDLVLVAALAVSAVVSVVTFIVSLAKRERARRAALVSGVLVFLTYAGLFLWSYFQMSMTASYVGETAPTLEICDLPTAIVAAVALFALCIGAIASDRRLFVNAILLLIPLLIAFLMCYPGTETMVLASMGILSFDSATFAKIAELIFMVTIAFNIVVSAIRIVSPRRYPFDCVRFALMLVGAALTVIAFIVSGPNGSSAIFKGTQLFCTIGWLALVVLGFVFSIVIAVLAKRAAAYAEDEYDEEYDETYGEDDAEPEEEAAEEPVEEPEEEPAEGAEEEVAEEPVEEPEEEAAEEPEPEPAPLPEPEPEPEPEPAPVEKEAPMSEFERRMAALARGEQPEPATAQQHAPQPQPLYPPYAPHMGGYQQQRMASFGYQDINQYTYDPFINGLTPQEKNEFGDLFIACKFGKLEGLPIYVIGGNNEEFFRKVFIYLGKFRKDISTALLDKLYLYVSRIG